MSVARKAHGCADSCGALARLGNSANSFNGSNLRKLCSIRACSGLQVQWCRPGPRRKRKRRQARSRLQQRLRTDCGSQKASWFTLWNGTSQSCPLRRVPKHMFTRDWSPGDADLVTKYATGKVTEPVPVAVLRSRLVCNHRRSTSQRCAQKNLRFSQGQDR